MADRIRGIQIVLDGETTGLKKALSGVTKESISIQNELRQVDRLLKFSPDNVTALAQKQELLSKQIEVTSQKLQGLKNAQSQVEQQFQSGKIGEEQYRAFQREIEFTEASLNRFKSAYASVGNTDATTKMTNGFKSMDSEIKKVSEDEKKLSLTEGLNKLQTTTDIAKDKITSLKNTMIGIGATVAGGAGLFEFSEKAIDAGNNAYVLSQKLHLTTGETAQLNKMFSVSGVDSTAFASTMTRLDKSILGAGASGNSTTKMLKEYGVSLTDASGKMLPMNDQLEALAVAYKKSADAGNEDAFSAEVLGAKGQSLIPLLENYTETKEAASKVKGAFTINPEEAHKTEEDLKVLKLQVAATGSVLAKAFIPLVQEALPTVTDAFQKLATLISSHKDEIDSFVQSIVDIAQKITETVKPVIEGLFNFISEHGDATKNIVIGIGTAFLTLETVKGVINGITGAMKLWDNAMKIKESITAMIEVVKGWEIATKLQTVAQGALNLVMDANPITLIVLAIAGLVAGILYLWNTNEGFRNAVIGIWEGIKNTIGGVVSAIGNFFTQTLPNAWNGFKASISALWEWIKAFFAQWGPLILTFIAPVIGIPLLIAQHWDTIKAFFTTLWENVKITFSNALTSIKTNLENIWNGISTTVTNVWNAIKDFFVNLWNGIVAIATGIWNGFSSFMAGLWEGIKNTAINAWNTLKDTVVGILERSVQGWINIFNGIINFFTNLPGTLYNLGVNMFSSLRDGISSILNTIGGVVSNGFNGAINFITSLPGRAVQWGKDFIQGLINGIMSMFGSLEDAVYGVGDKIRSFLHFSVPDEGPLSLAA